MLISILVMSALFATVVAAKNVKNATLAETRFVGGKGVVFLFNYTGKFKEADLKGAYMFIGSNRFNLDCTLSEWEQIACAAPGIKQFTGQNITGTVAGFRFNAIVPIAEGNNCIGHGFSATGIHPKKGYRFNSDVIIPTGRSVKNWLYPGEKITSKITCITVQWPGYPNPFYNEVPLP